MKTIYLLFGCLLLLLSPAGFSQSLSRHVVASSGDVMSNASISLSWTIGQGTPTQTWSATGITLTQGFQQADIKVTATDHNNDGKLEFSVYPNPSSSNFNLLIDNPGGILSYRLYDLRGKLLLEKTSSPIIPGIYQDVIPTYDLATGTYYLQLLFKSNNGKETIQAIQVQYLK